MDPLLKEFLIFFGVWPIVILMTVLIGKRIGRWMARGVQNNQLKAVAARSADIARQRL